MSLEMFGVPQKPGIHARRSEKGFSTGESARTVSTSSFRAVNQNPSCKTDLWKNLNFKLAELSR